MRILMRLSGSAPFELSVFLQWFGSDNIVHEGKPLGRMAFSVTASCVHESFNHA